MKGFKPFCARFIVTQEGTKDVADVADVLTMQLLLFLAADTNIISMSPDGQERQRHGSTPLHLAITERDTKTVQNLIKANADPDVQDADGKTALQLAAEFSCGQGLAEVGAVIIGAGVAAGKDVNTGWDSAGMTPLMYACKYRLTAIIEALVKAHADPTVKNANGKTVFERKDMDGEMVDVLIGAGVSVGKDVNTAWDSPGMTPLMYASKFGLSENVIALVQKGASLDVVNEEGMTALFYAAESVSVCECARARVEKDQLEVVKALLAAGSSLNARDKQGQTALHYTMKYQGEPSSRSCWPYCPLSPGTPRLLLIFPASQVLPA
jgi:ankyrin repeat protein